MNFIYELIGVPLGYLMSLIYNIVPNYAIAIILFTLVTKLLLFPFNYKTQKNAARMQLLQPKLNKLQKSFANNPTRLQEEQNKLYSCSQTFNNKRGRYHFSYERRKRHRARFS